MLDSHENRAKLFETIFGEIDANIDRSIDPLIDFPYEKVLIHNQLAVLEDVLLRTKNGDVLEIGSGFGQVPSLFSYFGYRAVGGDLFPRKYSQKIWKILSKKYGCSFVKFDGVHLPFRGESFDIVVFLGVLEYIGAGQLNSKQETDLQFIREIWSVLKGNGKLLMSVPNKYSFFKFPNKLRTLPVGYAEKEIFRMVHCSGFRVVNAWRDNFLPMRVRRISPVLERITSRICKIYLLADVILSQTILGVTSTNLHYVFLKSPKSLNRTSTARIVVRAARTTDLPIIYKVLDESFDSTVGYLRKRGIVSKLRLNLPILSYILESFFIQEGDLSLIYRKNENYLPKYFVAESGENILGVCGVVNEISTSTWRLFTIAVLPAFRRKGIAKKLLANVISYLKNMGASSIYLGVPRDNRAAIELYRKIGFIPAETTSFAEKQLLKMELCLTKS